MERANLILAYIIGAVILFIIFLILRELNCWYWKINERISLQKEQIIMLNKILHELNPNHKYDDSFNQINNDVNDGLEKSNLQTEPIPEFDSKSQLIELYDNIDNMTIEEQLKLLEGMDDSIQFKIRSNRNNELHDTTVKEWKEFIKAGTYKAFKLVKEEV